MNNLGNICELNEQIDKALEWYRSSLQIRMQLEKNESNSESLDDLAYNLYKIGLLNITCGGYYNSNKLLYRIRFKLTNRESFQMVRQACDIWKMLYKQDPTNENYKKCLEEAEKLL